MQPEASHPPTVASDEPVTLDSILARLDGLERQLGHRKRKLSSILKSEQIIDQPNVIQSQPPFTSIGDAISRLLRTACLSSANLTSIMKEIKDAHTCEGNSKKIITKFDKMADNFPAEKRRKLALVSGLCLDVHQKASGDIYQSFEPMKLACGLRAAKDLEIEIDQLQRGFTHTSARTATIMAMLSPEARAQYRPNSPTAAVTKGGFSALAFSPSRRSTTTEGALAPIQSAPQPSHPYIPDRRVAAQPIYIRSQEVSPKSDAPLPPNPYLSIRSGPPPLLTPRSGYVVAPSSDQRHLRLTETSLKPQPLIGQLLHPYQQTATMPNHSATSFRPSSSEASISLPAAVNARPVSPSTSSRASQQQYIIMTNQTRAHNMGRPQATFQQQIVQPRPIQVNPTPLSRFQAPSTQTPDNRLHIQHGPRPIQQPSQPTSQIHQPQFQTRKWT